MTDKMKGVTINRTQRLFIIPCGSGYSCLGFDVCAKRTNALANWLGRDDLKAPARKGTKRAWLAYQSAMDAARAKVVNTKQKCPCELTPALVGYEGRRIEVAYPNGERKRFNVGRSMGWMPVHLEIHNSRSHGGFPVYWPDGTRIARIIR